MISKPFYLENLSAFDILIQDDREKAELVIYRVFSMLQRDKIWLQEVATEEEIFEEDVELLEEVEAELKELEVEFDFRFAEFYELVQQKLKSVAENSTSQFGEFSPKVQNDQNFDLEEENEDFDIDQEDDDFEEEDDDFENDDNIDLLNSASDEELDQIGDVILQSAKLKFDYEKFVYEFPVPEENFVDHEFLLPLIIEKADEENVEVIARKMQSSFLMSGLQIEIDYLISVIDEKSKELAREILAFKIAADSLQQGATPKSVVQQISDFLKI